MSQPREGLRDDDRMARKLQRDFLCQGLEWLSKDRKGRKCSTDDRLRPVILMAKLEDGEYSCDKYPFTIDSITFVSIFQALLFREKFQREGFLPVLDINELLIGELPASFPLQNAVSFFLRK